MRVLAFGDCRHNYVRVINHGALDFLFGSRLERWTHHCEEGVDADLDQSAVDCERDEYADNGAGQEGLVVSTTCLEQLWLGAGRGAAATQPTFSRASD